MRACRAANRLRAVSISPKDTFEFELQLLVPQDEQLLPLMDGGVLDDLPVRRQFRHRARRLRGFAQVAVRRGLRS